METMVLWSGGRDSTLVLYDLLKGRQSKVRTISIHHNQVVASEVQARHRKCLKEKLEAEFGKFDSIDVTIVDNGSIKNGDGLIQPLMWIPTATMYLNKSEHLYTGYTRGDDIWHYKETIQRLFTECQAITEKTGKLYYPLEWYDKVTVIKDLQTAQLLDYTWYCQDNGIKPCGWCVSCKHNEEAMFRIQKDENAGQVISVEEPLSVEKSPEVLIIPSI